jgi:hypothetical protein
MPHRAQNPRPLSQIKLLSSLRRQLAKLNTESNLQELIINCIDCAIDDQEIPTDGPFREALESQECIGWLGMIRGYWSQEWQIAFEWTYLAPAEESRKQKNKRQLQMKNDGKQR